MSIAEDFLAKQRREIERTGNKVLSGKCETFEDYKAECARIAAHNLAIRNFQDVMNLYLEEEETDNLAEQA